MIYRIEQRAERELSDAVSWYEQDSVMNVRRFVRELRSLIGEIINMPERYPPACRGARQAKMKRYPYYVIDDVSPDVITVIAIAHVKRRPGCWLERLA